jgi:adenine-specific DNA-methyltransferase
MSTVFVGGSRRVSRLPAEAKERLNNVVGSGFNVIVGDANGADKAVQKHLMDAAYDKVMVFCSGRQCRNNLGNWPTRNVEAPKSAKGFQFYAAKDREMAREADFGLMLWDGKSAGTVLNVLRLIGAGKKAVLLNTKEKSTTTFKAATDWETFLARCDGALKTDLRERATADEWSLSEPPQQVSLFDAKPAPPGNSEDRPKADDELIADINAALASGNPRTVVDVLGTVARTRSMSQVAKQSGLSRESLYRALSTGGNPEFATVLKVLDAVGLRLTVDKAAPRLSEGAE